MEVSQNDQEIKEEDEEESESDLQSKHLREASLTSQFAPKSTVDANTLSSSKVQEENSSGPREGEFYQEQPTHRRERRLSLWG